LARRVASGRASKDRIASPARCAKIVTTPEARASAKNGIFSTASADTRSRPTRPSGQKSSKHSTSGSVTSIGFASSPSAKSPSARA
jgi:hypothetical protein